MFYVNCIFISLYSLVNNVYMLCQINIYLSIYHQYNIQYNNTAMHIYQNISTDNILMIHNIYVHSFSLIIMIILLIRHQQTHRLYIQFVFILSHSLTNSANRHSQLRQYYRCTDTFFYWTFVLKNYLGLGAQEGLSECQLNRCNDPRISSNWTAWKYMQYIYIKIMVIHGGALSICWFIGRSKCNGGQRKVNGVKSPRPFCSL